MKKLTLNKSIEQSVVPYEGGMLQTISPYETLDLNERDGATQNSSRGVSEVWDEREEKIVERKKWDKEQKGV